MGFMDKAKKMAEQAQAKLDEAQKQFNQGGSTGGVAGGGPATEYDEHGRPIPASAPPPPHGDPVAGAPADAPPPAPTPDPAAAAPPSEPTPPAPEPAAQDDPNSPNYAPPKLSSGDPLGG